MKKKKNICLTKYVFEVRFKEIHSVLDNRGKWADDISRKLNFNEWKIEDSRVFLISQKNLEVSYFSTNNFGYSIENNSDIENFFNRINDFMNILMSEKVLGNSLHMNRIGVRTEYCDEYSGNFNSLLRLYSENFAGLNENAKNKLDVNIEDIGTVYDLTDKLGNIHISSGPMKKEQIKENFKKAENIPEVGLYIDIDYWKNPNAIISLDSLKDIINTLALVSLEKKRIINELVMGE